MATPSFVQCRLAATLGALLVVAPAWAQAPEDGPVPAAAPAQVAQPGPTPAAERPAELETGPATPPPAEPALAAAPVVATNPSPAPERGAPPPTAPVHLGHEDGLRAQLGGHLRASYLGLQGIASDRDGTVVGASPFETRIRLSPSVQYARAGIHAEFDMVTGALSGLPSRELRLGPSAHPELSLFALRQLYAELRGQTFALRVGQQTSNWGLGLVANHGNADAVPGEFGDARYGDLAWRAAFAGRPLYGLGGAWRAIEPILAADMIVRDDTAAWSNGDRALQGVLALRFNVDAERNFGVYTVYRQQRLEGATDGARSTDAFVVDLSAKWRWGNERSDVETRLGAEVAWITGTSTMARSDTAPILRLDQFGAAFKATVRIRRWEAQVDVGYASGDQNPYDDRLEAFRFDPDYHAGLILYEEVMGWQSARTFARASDPEVIGVPPEGMDLLPTRGSVTGSTYVFPRVRHAVRDWLDVYGGPLFAFATAAMADPFNTRIDGGTPRNALGGRPGRFLGAELDVGVQARTRPARGMEASLTAEAGYFLPGDAFVDANGRHMAPVAAGRVRASVSF